MNKLAILIILSICFVSCSLFIPKSNYLIKILPTPHGTIEIGNNLYFDKTEIPNNSYLNYVFWTADVYGDTSLEFQNVCFTKYHWSEFNENYKIRDTLYYSHPAYRWHPAVGLTYEQALSFTKWRSDRLFEFYLIYNKTIKENLTRNKDSIFTTEKYFNGNYNGVEPNYEIKYPEYSLPSIEDYEIAYQFADSLNSRNYKKCRQKFCKEDMLIDCNSIETNSYGGKTTRATKCNFCKKDIISHLKGNVREYTNISLIYGASFVDSAKFENTFRALPDNVNCYTGFRNVCSYQKWIKNDYR